MSGMQRLSSPKRRRLRLRDHLPKRKKRKRQRSWSDRYGTPAGRKRLDDLRSGPSLAEIMQRIEERDSHLDDRTPIQRLLGDPPLWRSALVQFKRSDPTEEDVEVGFKFASQFAELLMAGRHKED